MQSPRTFPQPCSPRQKNLRIEFRNSTRAPADRLDVRLSPTPVFVLVVPGRRSPRSTYGVLTRSKTRSLHSPVSAPHKFRIESDTSSLDWVHVLSMSVGRIFAAAGMENCSYLILFRTRTADSGGASTKFLFERGTWTRNISYSFLVFNPKLRLSARYYPNR